MEPESIGAEVGQKMRSAIKAKLMELECYVDDELPDYIMVMVANRRSKSQMTEDLGLFLSAKTSTFVNWLHIVLKRLKKVTVTNPEVYKNAIKRKSSDPLPDDKSKLKVKVEKSHKKVKKEAHSKKSPEHKISPENENLITDNLPISANKFAENRKIIISEAQEKSSSVADDSFDIPLLSEVSESTNEHDLKAIERKIRDVKSRLGLVVESDNEGNDSKIKLEQADQKITYPIERSSKNIIHQTFNEATEIIIETDRDAEDLVTRSQRKRITFEEDTFQSSKSPSKRSSVLDRLGKRVKSPERSRKSDYRQRDKPLPRNRRRSSTSKSRSRSRSPFRNKTAARESLVSRVGVQSKVSVVKRSAPVQMSDEEEDEKIVREVPSLIKVKPRVIPKGVVQPNKNLLLKAVAEAQRSIAQTPKVGKDIKPDGLFTKSYIQKRQQKPSKPGQERRPDQRSSVVIKKTSSRIPAVRSDSSSDEYDSDGAYIPKPVKNTQRDFPSYVPSSTQSNEAKEGDSKENGKPHLIITLENKVEVAENRTPVKLRLDVGEKKRPHSPIVFEQGMHVKKRTIGEQSDGFYSKRPDIPDKLPIVRPPLSIKNKQRCKYWPSCRQGDKCEFVHPTDNCQMFPNCKFGDSCMFLHPKCKFGVYCTKRGCMFSHKIFKSNHKLINV